MRCCIVRDLSVRKWSPCRVDVSSMMLSFVAASEHILNHMAFLVTRITRHDMFEAGQS
jgi:hypothetical protein